MPVRYALPLEELSPGGIDAAEAAERTRAVTLVLRGGRPIAAIVGMPDYERIDPPDPGSTGDDPLLAMCGSCRHDAFVDGIAQDLNETRLF